MKWLIRLLVLGVVLVALNYAFSLGALTGLFIPSLAEKSADRARGLALLLLDSAGYHPCQIEDTTSCGFQDTSNRTQVNCSDYIGDKSAVIMTFGQSNSANAGSDRYIPIGPVANFNVHDGQCYVAEDPLLGPDADGGSVWGVLADKLIAEGHFQRVLLVPFGIGGTEIERWIPTGDLHPRIEDAAAKVLSQGIVPTHVLWHQGESDAGQGTSTQAYVEMFDNMIDALRGYGINAPIYPAIATYCEFLGREASPEELQGQKQVREAQLKLSSIDGVFPGPDTDTIKGRLYRYDHCHFNHKGMQAHADLWVEALSLGHN